MHPLELARRDQSEEDGNLDGFVFLVLVLLITMIRTYSRWDLVGLRGFQADDYLVWFAAACYAGDTINMWQLQTTYSNLANSEMTAEARAGLDPDSEEYRLRVGGAQLHLAEWFIYGFLLWSLKLAVLFNVMRLMQGLNGYRIRIRIGFGMIAITFLVAMLVPFLSCVPTTKYWQISPDPGQNCYAETSPAILWTFLVCNVLTDIYLTVLPMPMLWKTTLPKPTKIALIFLFGCGILVAVAATLRAGLITSGADFHNVAFLPVREAFIAVLTTNLPSIFVLLRRWLSPFFSVLRTARTTRTGNGGTTGRTPTHIQYQHQHPRGGGGHGSSGSTSTAERRGTFVDQMFVRGPQQQGPKTEVYSMKRIETFSSTTEMTGSQERIFQQASMSAARSSRDSSEEDRNDCYHNNDKYNNNNNNNNNNARHSMGTPHGGEQMLPPTVPRPSIAKHKLGAGSRNQRSRSQSQSRARPASGADDVVVVENHPPGYGITKQVEITITEERAERPGHPFDEFSGRRSQMLSPQPSLSSSVTGPPSEMLAVAARSGSSMDLR